MNDGPIGIVIQMRFDNVLSRKDIRGNQVQANLLTGQIDQTFVRACMYHMWEILGQLLQKNLRHDVPAHDPTVPLAVHVLTQIHLRPVDVGLRELVFGVDIEGPDQRSNRFVQDHFPDQLLGLIPLIPDAAADILAILVRLTDAIHSVHEDGLWFGCIRESMVPWRRTEISEDTYLFEMSGFCDCQAGQKQIGYEQQLLKLHFYQRMMSYG